MTDRPSTRAACFQRLPEDAYSMTVNAVVTRRGAAGIMARAELSPPDQCRLLALPYPVEYRVFWQLLAGLGVTQAGLMERMGASP